MSDLAAAIGLALAIEGALYAGLPQAVKSFMRRAVEMPDGAFRGAGLGALAAGLAIVWLVRG